MLKQANYDARIRAHFIKNMYLCMGWECVCQEEQIRTHTKVKKKKKNEKEAKNYVETICAHHV